MISRTGVILISLTADTQSEALSLTGMIAKTSEVVELFPLLPLHSVLITEARRVYIKHVPDFAILHFQTGW